VSPSVAIIRHSAHVTGHEMKEEDVLRQIVSYFLNYMYLNEKRPRPTVNSVKFRSWDLIVITSNRCSCWT